MNSSTNGYTSLKCNGQSLRLWFLPMEALRVFGLSSIETNVDNFFTELYWHFILNVSFPASFSLGGSILLFDNW